MENFKQIASRSRAADLLKHGFYSAHTQPAKPNEGLAEHSDLVVDYLLRLVEANRLEPIIDGFIRNIADTERLRGFIKELFLKSILYHDFGKVNKAFQIEKLGNAHPSMPAVKHPFGSNHSIISTYIYLMHMLSNPWGLSDDELGVSDYMCVTFANSILRHHSSFISCASDIDFRESADALSGYLTIFNADVPDLECLHSMVGKPESIQSIIAGISEYDSCGFSILSLARLNYSLLLASDYYAACEYCNDHPTTDFGSFDAGLRDHIYNSVRNTKPYNKFLYQNPDLYKGSFDQLRDKSNGNLNALRGMAASRALHTIRNSDSRLYYLESPTGCGKTNIAMLAMEDFIRQGYDRAFYIFPFTSLVDQTFDAIRETLDIGNESIARIHSGEGFHQDGSHPDGVYGSGLAEYMNNHFINYPITALTHVKFFNILFGNSRKDAYIFHKLARSVVIIDELQSYPPKKWDRIIHVLYMLSKAFDIKVLMMSATLPKLHELGDGVKVESLLEGDFRDRLFANPNFAGRVEFDFGLASKGLPIGDDQRSERMAELADRVIGESNAHKEKYGSAKTVVQFIRKDTARQFYHFIEQTYQAKAYLLSSEILRPRRDYIIRKVRDSPDALLITTQVIECGVDIDMDLGFKNRSLIDSDEQLAGRVNRNATKEGSKVFLFELDDPEPIYGDDYRLSTSGVRDIKVGEGILKSKDFGLHYYDEVYRHINNINKSPLHWNLGDFKGLMKKGDHANVAKEMRMVDTEAVRVYCLVAVPLSDLSPKDIGIAERFDIPSADGNIAGWDVLKAYREIITNRGIDWTNRQIGIGLLKSLIAKFTISVYPHRLAKMHDHIMLGEDGEPAEEFGMVLVKGSGYCYERGLVVGGTNPAD